MAQGKKEDSAIFRQPSLPPSNDTPHILQGMSDDDSDAGSFLDNDTEDFLPSGLVSGEMKEVLSHYKLRKRDTAKSKPATMKLTPSAIIKKPAPKQRSHQTLAPSSLGVDLSTLSITNEVSATVLQTSTCTTSSLSRVAAAAI